MTIPNFQSEDHQTEYELIFEQKATIYINMMNKVKDMMYGTGYGNYANLPGKCQEVIKDITQSLLYDVEVEFEKKFPEYKRDDDVFIPYRSFKENVTEALKEAMDTANKEKWFHPESGLAKNFDLGEK